MNHWEIYLDQHDKEWLCIPHVLSNESMKKGISLEGHTFHPLSENTGRGWSSHYNCAAITKDTWENFDEKGNNDCGIQLTPTGKKVESIKEWLPPIILRLGENYMCGDGKETGELIPNESTYDGKERPFHSSKLEANFSVNGGYSLNGSRHKKDIIAHIPKKDENTMKTKFAAVSQSNSLILMVCLNENNVVVPFAHEDCPHKGKIFAEYTALDINYETYCKLAKIQPKLKDELPEKKEELKKRLKSVFGCQTSNLEPLIEPLFQLLEGTAKLPKVVTGVNDPDFGAMLGNVISVIFHKNGNGKDADKVFGDETGRKISSLVLDIKAYVAEFKKREGEK